MRTSYADPSNVSGLFESTLPFLSLPLTVAWLRKFGSEAVRRQATVAAVAAMATAGAGPRSTGPRTAWLPAAVRTRSIRQRHAL